METKLADWIKDTPEGREAESVLRACVHCGFCTATCPTYQLLGDELDGPRGRIYLIKQLLEGRTATEKTRLHLDRCLTCRACETTCPSGVKYHRLLDIGRQVLTDRLPRPLGQRLVRQVLAEGMTRPRLFGLAVRLGRWLRPILPSALGDKIPPGSSFAPRLSSPKQATRRVLMLAGCVQPGLAPSINVAARQVLAALSIDAIEVPKAGCCGALRFHLDAQQASLDDTRALIDAWWTWIEQGAIEAIIVTTSGCGAHLKDVGHLLKDDPGYVHKAAKVSALCRDIGDFLLDQTEALLPHLTPAVGPLAQVGVHTPCTLQHGLKRKGDMERLLLAAGYRLTPVAEAHLCCGSAGTYSITQPELSGRLRDRKLEALLNTPTGEAPEVIATANIGCLMHLQSGTLVPVRHWIELISERLAH